MIETIWNNIQLHEGELFFTTGKPPLELRYQMADENHLIFSRTSERVSKAQIQKVYDALQQGSTPAQINKKVRASYYILALLQDERIS